ncbi:MAG: hypothetical protein E7280_03420 [Lachnospiraceae bacterium]|nr:hypothetical protein [Lachnospiraceae bacterium]
MDYSGINDFLQKQGVSEDFAELMKLLVSPSYCLRQIGKLVGDAVLPQKEEFLTLGLMCLLFGAVSQLVLAFGEKENKGFLDTIIFMCASGICLRLFLQSFTLVGKCILTLGAFMKVLLPVFCIGVLFTKGVHTASLFYAAVMGEICIFQLVISQVCLPASKLLIGMNFANALSGQKLFERFSKLLSDGINLLLKGMLALISGFQIVQELLAPGMDVALREGVKKAAGCLPGLITASSACVGLISGLSENLKNSMGGAGMFVVFLLFFPTFLTLLLYLAAFRILEACVSPFTTDAMNRVLMGTYEGVLLLFKLLLHTVTFLLVSLCIMTALS